MKLKLLSVIVLAFSSTLAFAGHPAADRMVDALEEGFRILDYSGSSQKRAMCRFISRYVSHQNIAVRLLGHYAQSGDSAGVQEFRRHAASFMVTKAFPKIKDLNGQSGSYTVSDNVSSGSGGTYSVPVTVRTSKGKTYSGRATLTSSLKIIDVTYLGFSGVNYIGREVRKEIDRFRSSSAPVSAYMNDLKSKSDFISCR